MSHLPLTLTLASRHTALSPREHNLVFVGIGARALQFRIPSLAIVAFHLPTLATAATATAALPQVLPHRLLQRAHPALDGGHPLRRLAQVAGHLAGAEPRGGALL